MGKTDKYMERIKQIIFEFIGDEPVKIILFGSRARGDSRKGSDVDIGILPKRKWNKKKLIYLQEELENSTIPYIVETVDLSSASLLFRKQAMKEGVIWKE